MKKVTFTVVFAFILCGFINQVNSKFNPEYPAVKSALSPGHTFVITKKKRKAKENINPDLKNIKDSEWWYFAFEKDFGYMNRSREAVEEIKQAIEESTLNSIEIIANPVVQPNAEQKKSQSNQNYRKMNIPQTIWNREEIGTGSLY